MTRAIAASTGEEEIEDDDAQIIGRKIWRVLPYIIPYRKRAAVGILSNALARASDLLPLVFIGYAVDYYGGGGARGPVELLRMVSDNLAIGYGILIFLGFASLALWQGISEYSWQTLGYKVQHDVRIDATRSLIQMEASYYDLRQT